MDGHSNHISLRMIELANEENIILIKFPIHLTDKIQPLDVSVFSQIKRAWNEALVEHGKNMMGQRDSRLQKSQSLLLSKVWLGIKPVNTINGFRCTGLAPFDKTMVKDSWFTAKALSRNRSHQKGPQQIFRDNLSQAQIISDPHVEFPGLELEDAAIPLDLSMPKASVDEEKGQDVADIIKIFTENINRGTSSAPTAGSSNRGCRLKHHTMGEGLNTEEVLARLAEHEEKKSK